MSEATAAIPAMIRELTACIGLPGDHPRRVAALAEKRRLFELIDPDSTGTPERNVGTASDSSGGSGPVREGGPASHDHGASWQPGDPLYSDEDPDRHVCPACGTSWVADVSSCPDCGSYTPSSRGPSCPPAFPSDGA